MRRFLAFSFMASVAAFVPAPLLEAVARPSLIEVSAGRHAAQEGEGSKSGRLFWRRTLLEGAAAAALATASLMVPPALAVGPVKIALTSATYREVVCPPKTTVPGVKAGAGLRPVCVVVTAKADNPGKKEVLDAAVFGRIFDEDGTSVVANNPDSNTDAGQFAIVDKIAPGKSEISFQFIAAIDPAQDFSKKRLEFESLKAISYPGGARYKEITECDMNPLGEGCDF